MISEGQVADLMSSSSDTESCVTVGNAQSSV